MDVIDLNAMKPDVIDIVSSQNGTKVYQGFRGDSGWGIVMITINSSGNEIKFLYPEGSREKVFDWDRRYDYDYRFIGG